MASVPSCSLPSTTMQLFPIVFMVAIAAEAAQFKPDQKFSFDQNQNQNFGRDFNQQQQQPIFKNKQPEVIILNQNFAQDLAGNYEYSYELSDGQQVQQTGRVQPGSKPETGNLEQTGSFQFVGDDGKTRRVEYTASKDGGFQAEGDHLPTPPPQIPEYEQLRQDFPELFWAEQGDAGTNQQKYEKQGQFFF